MLPHGCFSHLLDLPVGRDVAAVEVAPRGWIVLGLDNVPRQLVRLGCEVEREGEREGVREYAREREGERRAEG